MIILIGLFLLLVLLFWCCRRAPAYYPDRSDSDCERYCETDCDGGGADHDDYYDEGGGSDYCQDGGGSDD